MCGRAATGWVSVWRPRVTYIAMGCCARSFHLHVHTIYTVGTMNVCVAVVNFTVSTILATNLKSPITIVHE